MGLLGVLGDIIPKGFGRDTIKSVADANKNVAALEAREKELASAPSAPSTATPGTPASAASPAPTTSSSPPVTTISASATAPASPPRQSLFGPSDNWTTVVDTNPLAMWQDTSLLIANQSITVATSGDNADPDIDPSLGARLQEIWVSIQAASSKASEALSNEFSNWCKAKESRNRRCSDVLTLPRSLVTEGQNIASQFGANSNQALDHSRRQIEYTERFTQLITLKNSIESSEFNHLAKSMRQTDLNPPRFGLSMGEALQDTWTTFRDPTSTDIVSRVCNTASAGLGALFGRSDFGSTDRYSLAALSMAIAVAEADLGFVATGPDTLLNDARWKGYGLNFFNTLDIIRTDEPALTGPSGNTVLDLYIDPDSSLLLGTDGEYRSERLLGSPLESRFSASVGAIDALAWDHYGTTMLTASSLTAARTLGLGIPYTDLKFGHGFVGAATLGTFASDTLQSLGLSDGYATPLGYGIGAGAWAISGGLNPADVRFYLNPRQVAREAAGSGKWPTSPAPNSPNVSPQSPSTTLSQALAIQSQLSTNVINAQADTAAALARKQATEIAKREADEALKLVPTRNLPDLFNARQQVKAATQADDAANAALQAAQKKLIDSQTLLSNANNRVASLQAAQAAQAAQSGRAASNAGNAVVTQASQYSDEATSKAAQATIARNQARLARLGGADVGKRATLIGASSRLLAYANVVGNVITGIQVVNFFVRSIATATTNGRTGDELGALAALHSRALATAEVLGKSQIVSEEELAGANSILVAVQTIESRGARSDREHYTLVEPQNFDNYVSQKRAELVSNNASAEALANFDNYAEVAQAISWTVHHMPYPTDGSADRWWPKDSYNQVIFTEETPLQTVSRDNYRLLQRIEQQIADGQLNVNSPTELAALEHYNALEELTAGTTLSGGSSIKETFQANFREILLKRKDFQDLREDFVKDFGIEQGDFAYQILFEDEE